MGNVFHMANPVFMTQPLVSINSYQICDFQSTLGCPTYLENLNSNSSLSTNTKMTH